MLTAGSLSWSQTCAPAPLQKKVLDVEQSDWTHLLELTGMLPLLQLRPRSHFRGRNSRGPSGDPPGVFLSSEPTPSTSDR